MPRPTGVDAQEVRGGKRPQLIKEPGPSLGALEFLGLPSRRLLARNLCRAPAGILLARLPLALQPRRLALARGQRCLRSATSLARMAAATSGITSRRIAAITGVFPTFRTW
jgi:hypothetical protein